MDKGAESLSHLGQNCQQTTFELRGGEETAHPGLTRQHHGQTLRRPVGHAHRQARPTANNWPATNWNGRQWERQRYKRRLFDQVSDAIWRFSMRVPLLSCVQCFSNFDICVTRALACCRWLRRLQRCKTLMRCYGYSSKCTCESVGISTHN